MMEKPKPTVLIADDHQMFLDGLRGLLQDRYDIVGQANSGEELLGLAEEQQADVIVSDLSMPGLSGLNALKRLRSRGVTSKVIILTMHEEPEYAAEAINVGASGYVLKNEASNELISAVDQALAGGMHLPAAIMRDVLDIMSGRSDGVSATQEPLSERHEQILRYLAQGMVAKEIGDQLHISSRTVEYHKYKLMEKLGVKTTAELIQFAIKSGFLDQS